MLAVDFPQLVSAHEGPIRPGWEYWSVQCEVGQPDCNQCSDGFESRSEVPFWLFCDGGAAIRKLPLQVWAMEEHHPELLATQDPDLSRSVWGALGKAHAFDSLSERWQIVCSKDDQEDQGKEKVQPGWQAVLRQRCFWLGDRNKNAFPHKHLPTSLSHCHLQVLASFEARVSGMMARIASISICWFSLKSKRPAMFLLCGLWMPSQLLWFMLVSLNRFCVNADGKQGECSSALCHAVSNHQCWDALIHVGQSFADFRLVLSNWETCKKIRQLDRFHWILTAWCETMCFRGSLQSGEKPSEFGGSCVKVYKVSLIESDRHIFGDLIQHCLSIGDSFYLIIKRQFNDHDILKWGFAIGRVTKSLLAEFISHER